jgi:hypothetical protein
MFYEFPLLLISLQERGNVQGADQGLKRLREKGAVNKRRTDLFARRKAKHQIHMV